MVEYQVIDNFLTIRQHAQIYDMLCNAGNTSIKKIRWEFCHVLQNFMVKEEHRKYNYMFGMGFEFNKSCTNVDEKYDFLQPLFVNLNPLVLLRVKANLYYREDKVIPHGFHIDIINDKYPDSLKNKIKTAVYFVNTCNGKVLFEDGTEIDSIANRIVSFPMKTLHTGTSCTDQPFRCVININYIGLDI